MNKVINICLCIIFVINIPTLLFVFFDDFIRESGIFSGSFATYYLLFHIYFILPVGMLVCVLFPFYYKLHLIEKERKESKGE